MLSPNLRQQLLDVLKITTGFAVVILEIKHTMQCKEQTDCSGEVRDVINDNTAFHDYTVQLTDSVVDTNYDQF